MKWVATEYILVSDDTPQERMAMIWNENNMDTHGEMAWYATISPLIDSWDHAKDDEIGPFKTADDAIKAVETYIKENR